MKRLYIAILTLLFVTLKPVFAQDSIEPVWLQVIYPKNKSEINAYSTFFVGNTNPDAKLKINNMPVKVYPNGGFVHVVELNPGENQVELYSRLGSYQKKLRFKIKAPEYEQTLPEFPLQIDVDSISPEESFLYKTGDIIHVSFKGSPGQKAYFSVGKRRKNIPMVEQSPKFVKRKPIYGKSQNASYIPIKGIYKGTYKIQPKDRFYNEQITVKLVSKKDSISRGSGVYVSTIPDRAPPIMATVSTDYAVVRNAPGQSRLTPLPEGTYINITGRIGSEYRFKLGNNLEGWISAEDVTIMPEGTPFAESTVNIIDIVPGYDEIMLKVPLAQKLPFIIEQTSENEMHINIFGAKADIDLFSYDHQDKFLKEVKWTQESNDTVKIAIKAKPKQFWGYKYYYEGDTLVLSFRNPPYIDIDRPLKDKIICIDAGHGGKEEGAKGPTGVSEKVVNLKFAYKLKKILEKKGATVVMTRTVDEDLGLYDRVKFANDNDAHVILSIHNNSLPDGRNPFKEHGTSTYYYHSQSLPLARFIHKAVLDKTGFKDFGIFWSSFVLTRPTEALAVLLEIGFMINPEEYNLIIKSKFQREVAESIAKGLEHFFLSNVEKPKVKPQPELEPHF